MKFRKVTAIFPELDLKKVEEALIDIGVPGMTVTRAHGFGEYRNFFAEDCMSDCVRVEIFTEAEKASEIADTIARTVHEGMTSDGMIAILPVEEFMHIRQYGE